MFNVALAMIPLLLEPFFRSIKSRLEGWRAIFGNTVLGFAWLMFIPNAFYLLTDFMHLNKSVLVNERADDYSGAVQYIRGEGVYVFDSLLIFVATLFGAYVGGLALSHAYVFLKKHLRKVRATILLGIVLFLAGIGVYIGRFGRWNSWEAFYQPLNILHDFIHQLLNPQTRTRLFIVVLTIVLFQIMTLYIVHWIHSDRSRHRLKHSGNRSR